MPASDFTTKDYITLGLAVWGAVLSTVLAVRQVWRERPGVRVLVNQLKAQPPDQDEWRDYWRVRVINVRQRPIEVTQVGLRARSRLRVLDALLRNARPSKTILEQKVTIRGDRSASLPVVLSDGARATFYFEQERPPAPKVIGARVTDSLDRTYTGHHRPNSPTQLLWRLRWALFQRRRGRRRRRELDRRGGRL